MPDEVPASSATVYLREGETLLWPDRPDPACYQREQRNKAKSFFIGGAVFMCVCGLMSLYANGLVTLTVFTLVTGGALPLCFLTLSQARGVFVPNWWYAVTDQRVFSNYPTDDTEVIWQLPLTDISVVRLKKCEAGRGTISFSSFLHSHVPFECVEDAETVYDLIKNAKRHFELSFNPW